MRWGVRAALACGMTMATMLGLTAATATAGPALVATTDAQYLLYGRVFPDPQGCGNNPIGDPPAVSPWAKGQVCNDQFLGYDDVIGGTAFLQQRHSRYLQVIRLDQAYDDPNMRSAGLPTNVGVDEDGKPVVLHRDRRPLFLYKVTDSQSPIPENERKHFVYSMSIHGIERAGLEGGIRAMEDLVTWADCERDLNSSPACAGEGPFPKRIVETPSEKANPTAGDVLKRSVIYFFDPNPDGWNRGEVGRGGVFFQRYNGNGVDLNRNWPTLGYTLRAYKPGSEPEVKAFSRALLDIKHRIADKRFTGGIDLHGQLTASAFSYTLLGAGQRDYRRNYSSVDQALRAWKDQSERMKWSPYVGDKDGDGTSDGTAVFPVADQWGSVVDTLGYQITGGVGDWFDSDRVGLGAVGIDNEMSLSHLVPDIGYETINEQMHIDGNKGLIYSQIAALLNEGENDFDYSPPGKVGYVLNRKRVQVAAQDRTTMPELPAQNTISTIVPCTDCNGGTFVLSGTSPTLEFDVLGPDRGVWNGGLTATATWPSADGISPSAATAAVYIDKFDEGQWQNIARSLVSESTYLNAGQVSTVNDPKPGRWRVRIDGAGGPARITVDFNKTTAEISPGQAAIDASSMDFFDDLNRYIPDHGSKFEPVTVEQVIDDPGVLDRFDSLFVVNRALPAYQDAAGTSLGLSEEKKAAYYAHLKEFAQEGGNLILTDGALKGLVDLGLVPSGTVASNQPSGSGAVPRYQFSIGAPRGNLCTPTQTDPLLVNVCLPGMAGGTSRQGIEPTPLGYTPDTGDDSAQNNKMTQYYVTRTAWDGTCTLCTSGLLNNQTGLGRRPLGAGAVSIAGALLPDPNYNPSTARDMRFGVASYALSPAGWQIALNLANWRRPGQ